MQGAQFIEASTGDPPVYPGHPLTVALQIMMVFPGPDEGLKPAENGPWPAAVSDVRISGGGGEVRSACELLRRALGGAPAEELIAWADRRWVEGQAGGHVRNVEPGQQQADKLKGSFREKLSSWVSS